MRGSERGGLEKAELRQDQATQRSHRTGKIERGGGGQQGRGPCYTLPEVKVLTIKLMKRFEGILSVGWGSVACSWIKEKFYLLYHVPGATLARNRKGKKRREEQQKSWFLNAGSGELPTVATSTIHDSPARTQER